MGKKADPALAQAKQAIAASQPGMDLLLDKDPVALTDEELAAGVRHLRDVRALWQLKEERKGNSREGPDEAAEPDK